MEIFIREEEDRYILFFAHETVGHIFKKSLTNKEELENILRVVAYKYCQTILAHMHQRKLMPENKQVM